MGIIIVPIKLDKTLIDESINKFNLLNLRLRIMLTLAVSAVLFMLFDISWYSEKEVNIKKINRETSQLIKQSNDLINLQKEVNTKITNRNNNPKTLKLEKLKDEISTTYEQLEKNTVNLVKPEDMAAVLKEIIYSTKNLKIQALTKNKTKEIISSNNNEKNKKNENDENIKLYRHSFEIVLLGNYSSTHHFLKTLEEMKKKVSFDRFDYTVKTYPMAEIKLTVSTISLQREWIGG